MRLAAFVVALVIGLHAALWGLTRHEAAAPDVPAPLASVSYQPFAPDAEIDALEREARIRSDLKVLAPLTRAVRTYSSTGGVEAVPAIATEFGLRSTIGAWIGKDAERNEREIGAVVDLSRRVGGIDAIFVGNETLFRREQPADELVRMIQRVKRDTDVPVTTGEIWHVWLEHPELVAAVDYIAAHILPYWEGFSNEAAVDHAIAVYHRLREAYPGKRIVIAEFGWPSAGLNLQAANPGRREQAGIVRDFVARAEALGIDYNIVEAVDQPWKTAEGSVGPYWGLYDADRQPKFAWRGVISQSGRNRLVGLSLLLGLALSIPILGMRGVTLGQAGLLAVSANLAGAWLAAVAWHWQGHYFSAGAATAFAAGAVLLFVLMMVVLVRLDEIAAVALGRGPRRLIGAPVATLAPFAPKVSLHIPAYREPPGMLIETLESVARLDYENLECVVVINNTPDPALWQPVEARCRELGPRFKFVREDNLAGFKAGALRLALAHTAEDAEIIGVLDADYVVERDWLKDLVGLFADGKVGLVQAPQEHRDGGRSLMHAAMNSEYAGFFDIGMVQRNEVNAIVAHGTMCLVRRSALVAAGGWSSDTICEDTDLGLVLLELGWAAHYTNRRYGQGLLPDTVEAYRKQRFRWAYGGVQIIKKHWRRFLPGASLLSSDQKREFALGWVGWLGLESIGVVLAIFNIVSVPLIAFDMVAVPDSVLTVPIIASFAVTVMHVVMLYRLRCPMGPTRLFGAVVAAMSLQWTIAKAVATGTVTDHLPFARTAKGGLLRLPSGFPAVVETALGLLLAAGATTLWVSNADGVRELDIFAAVLALQSLPFLAAMLLAALERTPANAFAFWHGMRTGLARLRPQWPGRPAALARAEQGPERGTAR